MPLSARSRCYHTSTSAPAGCSGYSLEFSGPVFFLYSSNVSGTVGFIAFDNAQDHILVEGDEAGDISALLAAGYTQRGTLGYIWDPDNGSPSGNYYQPALANTGNVRNVRRYSLPSSGIHLYANNPSETAPGWNYEGIRGYAWGSRW